MNIKEIYQNKYYDLVVNIIRVLLILVCITIIYVLIKDVNTFKTLGSDVCAMCMNKTGCFCSCDLKLTYKEELKTTPIILEKIEESQIWEDKAFIFRGNGLYWDLGLNSSAKIDYEIESIKDTEIGVDTILGVYIYFLKSEKDFNRAVSMDRTKENFEFYDCTPKGQIKTARGSCIIKEGGLFLGNSQFNKDALVKIKIVIHSSAT